MNIIMSSRPIRASKQGLVSQNPETRAEDNTVLAILQVSSYLLGKAITIVLLRRARAQQCCAKTQREARQKGVDAFFSRLVNFICSYMNK